MKSKQKLSDKQKRWLFCALLVCLTLFFGWVVHTSTSDRLPRPGSAPTLFSNQCRDDLGITLSAAIKKAQDSIYLAIYSLSDERILSALQQATQRGCKVVVLHDWKATQNVKRLLGTSATCVARRPRGLMHQKILVVDEKQVWIGSANFTYESLRAHGNLVAHIESPELAKELIEHISSRLTRGPPLSHRFSFITQEQPIELWLLPDDESALDRLICLIDQAQSTLRIAMFTWTHPLLTSHVIKASQRGVKVEVVIDHHSAKGASKKAVTALAQADIAVRFSQGSSLLHHKMAWIDDSTLVLGSANWTQSAFEKNEDCFLIFHELRPSQGACLSKLWKVLVKESLLE